MAQGQERDAQGPRVDTETLLRILRKATPKASPGTLGAFRDQGLLPPRLRTGQVGRQPIWTYPLGAERQLRALIAWRKVTLNPDLLRVALWVDGYPVDLPRVQRSIRAALTRMAADIRRAADAAAPPDASEAERRRALAARAAGRRKSNTVAPRTRGVSAAERTNAMEALLNTFVYGESGDVSEDTAKQVEQLLGLQGARDPVPGTGAGPWLTGPPADIFDVAPHVGFQHFLDVAQTSTLTELELVRPSLNALLVGLPILAKLVTTVHGPGAAGLSAISDLGRQPELSVLLVPLLISLQRAGQSQGLMDVVAALEPTPALVTEILAVQDVSHNAVETNLTNLPPDEETSARALLGAPDANIKAALKRQAGDANRRRARKKGQS